MVHVIATIEVHPGSRDAFLAILKGNIPAVLAEDGCRRYEAAIDVESGIPAQGGARPDVVTILETWDSLPALHTHLKAPHMASYREKVKGLVKQVRLSVMQPA